MNRTILSSVILISVVVLGWIYAIHHQKLQTPSSTAATVISSNMEVADQQYAADLAIVNPNCAKYYDTVGQGPDPITTELADFTNLHPLSDFLCGDYSLVQPKAKLPDGKILHFIAPVSLNDCGATGHCTYYPLLEEKPGLVRHIRGFTSPNNDGSISQDTGGTIFAWEINYDPKSNQLLVDDTELGGCGEKDTYKFNSRDEPILILATDFDCSTNSTTTLFKL